MDKSSSKKRTASSKPTDKRQLPSQHFPERTHTSSSKPKKSSKDSSSTQKSATDLVRLHITPLTAESAKAIVPTKHLSTASFHSIDTFPEKSYGFVTIPRGEAEILRRKYHGTVFRGVKMNVEEARPDKDMDLSPNSEKGEISRGQRSKQKNREDGVLPGFELPEGRNVKRGWTKDNAQKAGKGKVTPSAGSSECLFKTVLPPVKASEAKQSDFSDEKSSKKQSKKRTVKNQVVIKEFKNSTKFPSFLKLSSLPTDSSGRSAGFMEGVGWIDESGEVIEGVPPKRRKLSVCDEPMNEDEDMGAENGAVDENMTESSSVAASGSASGSDSDSSESSSDSQSESDGAESVDNQIKQPLRTGTSLNSDNSEASSETDSSPSDSNSSDETGSDSDSNEQSVDQAPPKPASVTEIATKQPSSNFANLTSIFKPKLSLDTEKSGQFKFFGGDFDKDDDEGEDDVDEEDNGSPSKPFDDSLLYTPITPQAERYRSGAPTPDTAVAPRFKDFFPFPKTFDISVKREYFPTLSAERPEGWEKPFTGVRLLFPHTYDDNLHKISLWSSVNLPAILTTGILPGKEAKENAEDTKVTNNTKTNEPKGPVRDDLGFDSGQTVVTPKKWVGSGAKVVDQPRTGAGSSIVGWAGKKKTFDESDEFEETRVPVTTKAKMGAGSGVVGWAGKKKTFDDFDDDFGSAPPTVEPPAKAKTGSGSGVTGWAGKKITFDEEEEVDLAASAGPLKAKTGAGSGVTAWAGKKKTFDDYDHEDEVEPESVVAKPLASAQKLQMETQKPSQAGEGVSISQVWEKTFYENRGDWNRQWKRKRREVAKAKRRKEKAKRGWNTISS